MNKFVVAASFAFAAFAAANSAHAKGPDAKSCGVGKSAPAFQDAILADIDLTFTCDSAAERGGFNFKPLGTNVPVTFQKCVLRWMGVGFTGSCKINVTDYFVGPNGKVILVTNKGNLEVTTVKMFGKVTAIVKKV